MNRFLKYTLALAFALAFANTTFAQVFTPEGRLTLVSNTPVMTSDLTGATTIYYTPYRGNSIPSYSSVNQLNNNTFSQMALTLNNAVQSQGNIYDVFAFLITPGTTEHLCLGPAWTSTTSRGTGLLTTQLQQVQGIWTNAQTFTNTCWNGTTSYTLSPNQATYLGSVYMTGNASTSVQFTPAAAAGGSNTIIGLWNAYNRVRVTASSSDSNGSWTNSGSGWRDADNSANNSISWLDGLQQTPITAAYDATANNSSLSDQTNISVGINALSLPSMNPQIQTTTAIFSMHAATLSPPVLGFSTATALERVTGTGTTTFYGTLCLLTLETEY